MSVGWRRLVSVVRERGQSEVLGATLLTGIMVILVAMAGLFLFADFGGDEEQLLANIEGDVAAEGITLTHDGGDSFDSQDIAVVLTGDNDRDLALSDDFNASEGSDGQLAPGDVWRYNSSSDLILGSGRLLVVDESTNTVLLDKGYRVEVVPGGIELRVESFNHSNTQSDEADVYGEGDPSNDDDGVRWNYEAFVDFDDDGDPVKNPDEINISFDSSGPLEHNLTDHDLVAYNPSSNPETVTATASVDGFSQSDDVTVNVYEVAELSVSIDGVSLSGGSSTSSLLSPEQGSVGTLGVQQTGGIQVPKNSSIDVKFTAKNNDLAPAFDETVEISSPAFEDNETRQFGRVDPGEKRTGTVTFNIGDITGTRMITIKSGGNTDTFTLNIVESLFQVTDLVPNAKQQQTFRFNVDGELNSGQSIEIELPSAPGSEALDYSNADIAVEDGISGSSVKFTSTGNSVTIKYDSNSLIPAGTDVEIRVSGLSVGSIDEQTGPYEWELNRPGTDTKSTEATVSRDAGTPGLENIDVETLTSVGEQKLNISFEPTTDPKDIGNSETVAIDLTDALGPLKLGNAEVDNIDNGSKETDELDGNSASYLSVDLGNTNEGDTVEVTLRKVVAEREGTFDIGFSRGGNDTTSAPLEIEPGSQTTSIIESVKATDIVPNAPEQHQTLEVIINNSVDPSELSEFDTIDLTIDGHQSDPGQLGYGSASATALGDSGASISTNANDDRGEVTITYDNGSDLSPGDTVKLRVTGINADSLASQSDPYQVTASPSDRLGAADTTFNVSRSGSPSDAGLDSFSIENLAGTNTQTQEISFEPAGTFNSGERVVIEFNDAYIDGELIDTNDIQVVSGSGDDDESVSFDIDSNNYAYLKYKPGTEYGGEVTIELQGVNPDADALDESYEVGISRGSSGTAGATFGVFQPAQFDVSIQDNSDRLLGTQYGSTDGLSVTAEVENTASYTDTQTITLEGDGETSTTSVTLADGESQSVTLSLGSPNEGNYTATISSETDSATTDARVFADPPDFVAGLETVSGTAGETVGVELRATNLSSNSDTIGGYQVAISFNENTTLLSYESVQENEWNAPFENNLGDAVSVSDFNSNPATGKPALTFNFTLLGTGTTSLVFDDDATNGENQLNDDEGKRYDVLFINGEVTATSSS